MSTGLARCPPTTRRFPLATACTSPSCSAWAAKRSGATTKPSTSYLRCSGSPESSRNVRGGSLGPGADQDLLRRDRDGRHERPRHGVVLSDLAATHPDDSVAGRAHV